MRVQGIEYALEGIANAEPSYRLIASGLDIDAAPTVGLAALYHRRWRIEQSLDEFKVHLATRNVVPRSKGQGWSSRNSMSCFLPTRPSAGS